MSDDKSKSPREYAKNTKRRDKMLQDYDEDKNSTNIELISKKLFGKFFKDKDESEYQDVLRSSHMPIKADVYLSKVVLYSLISLLSIFLLSSILFFSLFSIGLFGLIVDSELLELILTITIILFITIITTSFISLGFYYYPHFKSYQRKTKIDKALPSSVTFMYALNRGGMNINDVIREISKNEDVYGEVSREFGTIVKDQEYFSRDLMNALNRASERTPSEKFSNFLDDLIGTMDTGAQLTPFLEDKTEEMIEDQKREQENFLETLSLMGEVYVTAFVAGPLFLIIITVIMAMMGGTNITQLDGIVYGVLPFVNIAFFVLIDILAGSEAKVTKKLELEDNDNSITDIDPEEFAEQNKDDERVQTIMKAKKKKERSALIRQPIKELLRNPDLTLLFTIPIAIIYIITVLLFGISTPTPSGFIENPVYETFVIILSPIFILTIPLSVFHEIKMRRESKIRQRFPDSLKKIAKSNSIGLSLTESLNSAAESTKGRLGDELKRARNDIRWNYNVNNALIKFSNRIQMKIVTRSIKLITKANQSTGDLEKVINVAAKNVKEQQRLAQERTKEMLMYTAIIIISYCVYLFVIAMLDFSFLSEMDEVSGASEEDGEDELSDDSDLEFSGLPVERLRLVFYHSTIVQGFGSGMLAGYLRTEDVRSGLKFAIILCLIATGVFAGLSVLV